MRPIRLVLGVPLGSRGEAGAAFFSISLVAHVFFLGLLILAPTFRGRSASLGDALVVELAGGLPGAPPEPAAPLHPPEPAPPPAARTESRPVALPDPAKKRTEKKDRKEARKEAPRIASPVPPSPEPASPSTGSGSAAPVPGTGSGITSLDASDLEFAWYRALVTSALKSRWVRPVLEGDEPSVTATVAFEIRRDGGVQDVRVETSSGVSVMDRSVLRAVIESSPLPPLPPSWREPTLPARFEFRWRPGDPD